MATQIDDFESDPFATPPTSTTALKDAASRQAAAEAELRAIGVESPERVDANIAAAGRTVSDRSQEQDARDDPGVPMESAPGKSMRFGNQPGLRGAEIVNGDGTITSFGGREGVEIYASENKLSDADRNALLALEQRGTDVSHLEALQVGRRQADQWAKEGMKLEAGGPAEGLARGDVQMLNKIEDLRMRMEGAASMAAIAEAQPAYKEALIANHQPEALEVAGNARFNVSRYTPGRGAEVVDFGNDADAAMLRYAEAAKRETVSALPAGGYVTLTDAELKLDAARTSEGHGTFREQFGKEDGRTAFAAAQATLATREAGVATRGDSDLNSLEPGYERVAQKLDGNAEAKRSAWLSKAKESEQPAARSAPTSDNEVQSDEIFTASQPDVKPLVPADVEQKFVRKGDKFYNQPDATRLEFQDKGNKLETRSNGEQVAEAMVRIAEARGWDEIRVNGSETFRREAWLEAAGRGMQVKGYAPSEQDKSELAKRRGTEAVKAVETKEAAPGSAARAAERESPNQSKAREFAEDRDTAVRKHPELAGAAAAAEAINKRAQADGLNAEQQAVVKARVQQNLVNSIERGNPPKVEIRTEVEARAEVETTKAVTR